MAEGTLTIKDGGTRTRQGSELAPAGTMDMFKDFFLGMPTRGRALFEMTVKNILYDKKTMVFLGLTMFLLTLPSYWAFTWADSDIGGLDLFVVITMMVYVQFIVLYACLLFGTSLFSEEEEQRTMTYLISRPVSNLEIVFYKYIGFIVSVFFLMVIPLLINFGIIATKTPFSQTSDFMFELGQFIGLLFMAIATWGALFMLFGVYLRKYSLMIGLLYALFWETFMANVPTSIRYGTITHYIRSIAPVYFSLGDDGGSLGSTPWEWALATLAILALIKIVITHFVLNGKDYH